MNIYTKWMDWFRSKPRWMQVAMIVGVCVLFVVGLWMSSTSAVDQSAGNLFNSTTWMIGVFLKLILVLGLIYGVAIIFKRSMTNSTNASVRQMKVQETLNLTPKRTLHIVRVGEQVLLIGATDQGISLLSELSPETAATQFQTLLQTAVAESSAGVE